MLQFVSIPSRHIKIKDKVLNTWTRKCETVVNIEYNREYYAITYDKTDRYDMLKPDQTLQVIIDVEEAL
jgi:hypothetical protein